ncbi:MAG TPA: hypothetical protein PKC29_11790 [Thermodesulfobacteriota bacterium]|nr:hypothetical protein [Thermodesulfobacteriota bacterium]
MKVIFMTLGALSFLAYPSYADSGSELRAEIIGEQGGKSIALDYTEYKPDEAKVECRELFHRLWEEHFKEMGFSTDEGVVDSYIKGCMKSYDKAFGK